VKRNTNPRRSWRITPLFAWYDIWIGVFIDRAKRKVYVFPVPCFGLVIELPTKDNTPC
jgi:hypothetical protein